MLFLKCMDGLQTETPERSNRPSFLELLVEGIEQVLPEEAKSVCKITVPHYLKSQQQGGDVGDVVFELLVGYFPGLFVSRPYIAELGYVIFNPAERFSREMRTDIQGTQVSLNAYGCFEGKTLREGIEGPATLLQVAGVSEEAIGQALASARRKPQSFYHKDEYAAAGLLLRHNMHAFEKKYQESKRQDSFWYASSYFSSPSEPNLEHFIVGEIKSKTIRIVARPKNQGKEETERAPVRDIRTWKERYGTPFDSPSQTLLDDSIHELWCGATQELKYGGLPPQVLMGAIASLCPIADFQLFSAGRRVEYELER